jgi:hypothetical protein
MSWKTLLRHVAGVNTQVLLLTIFLVWIVIGQHAVWIYGLSFAVHLVNLNAFLWRRTTVDELIAQSVVFRALMWGIMVALLVPTLASGIETWAIALLAAGTILHLLAFRALGLRRTYYSAELAADDPTRVEVFPYNVIPHPMALGSIMQFVGIWYINPDFHQQQSALMIGHIVFTVVTAVVEHFNLHFHDFFFRSVKSSFDSEKTKQTIDEICDWSLNQFRSDLTAKCSMHRYIKTLPSEIKSSIDTVRYADPVMEEIRKVFPQSHIVPLPMTDEIYISRYNIDRGGDQGLFDKHHDGNLRFMPGASVVRSLIYLSSEDDLSVVFETTGLRARMRTYDFGLLDFHKELHWVDGSYDSTKPPRILLKCNYYVDHYRFPPYRWIGIGANVAVFYVVKAAMEFSKSPKSLPQKFVGLLCNLFRSLNNLNPAAPLVLVAIVLALSTRFLLLQIGVGF